MQTTIKRFMGTDTTLVIRAGESASHTPPKSYVSVGLKTAPNEGIAIWGNTFDNLDANKTVYQEIVALLKAIHKNK